MERLLNRQEAAKILKLVRKHAPAHSHVDDVRWIGTCKRCGDDTMHCCHKGFRGLDVVPRRLPSLLRGLTRSTIESIQQQENL